MEIRAPNDVANLYPLRQIMSSHWSVDLITFHARSLSAKRGHSTITIFGMNCETNCSKFFVLCSVEPWAALRVFPDSCLRGELFGMDRLQSKAATTTNCRAVVRHGRKLLLVKLQTSKHFVPNPAEPPATRPLVN